MSVNAPLGIVKRNIVRADAAADLERGDEVELARRPPVVALEPQRRASQAKDSVSR